MIPFYTYILKCSDGSYYTGHTDNIYARMEAHNKGALKGYTSKRLPVELVWFYIAETRPQAYAIEQRVKKWSRFKKDALIKKDKALLKEFSKKIFKK